MVDDFIQKLDNKIRSALTRDTRVILHSLQPLELRNTPAGRRIVLDGLVEDIASKRIAVKHARAIVGSGHVVEDRLHIRSNTLSDAELRDKAARALLNEPVFRNCSVIVESGGKLDCLRDNTSLTEDLINVNVADGVITLTGQVNSLTHRRMAEVLLWWIDGCQCVDNLLEVVPSELDTDAELIDAIRMALEKDPLIDAGQIRVNINEGEVELLGQLPNEEQRRIAAQDAWSVPDVSQVNNRISIGRRTA